MMHLIRTLLLLGVSYVFGTHSCYAQAPALCGHPFSDDTTYSGQDYQKVLLEGEQRFQLSREKQKYRKSEGIITIPVVVRVVYADESENVIESRIIEQIEILNRAFNPTSGDLLKVPHEFRNRFADMEIQFCLASLDPYGLPTTGIIRERTTMQQVGLYYQMFVDSVGKAKSWDTQRYLNIWVANTGTSISGYAVNILMADSVRDGVVIHPEYFGERLSGRFASGKTLIHEIGHYLGLEHIWGVDEGCDSDDMVDDTPLQGSPSNGCPVYPQFSCGGSNMFMNYMDYSDDECLLMFTHGQKKRVRSILDIYRTELIQSNSVCQIPTNESENLDLYPNPTRGSLRIRSPFVYEREFTISVIDCAGRIVLQEIKKKQNEGLVDLSSLETGVYFVKIDNKVYRVLKI